MGTTAQDVVESEILDARLLALHAEKARIDADIAATTEDLRRLIEDRMFEYRGVPQTGGSPERPAKRRRTNFADTATASSIACLLRISERAAHRLVQYSNVLINYQPATHRALHDGLISWQHASTIIDECTGLPEGAAGLLETELLDLARDSTTTCLARRAKKLRTQLHPESLDNRARTVVERRRVDLDPDRDAMAWLHVYLPAVNATAIDAHLTHAARALQTPAEHRTLPQLRTDILTDLLLAQPLTCALGSRHNAAGRLSTEATGGRGTASQDDASTRAHHVNRPRVGAGARDDAPASAASAGDSTGGSAGGASGRDGAGADGCVGDCGCSGGVRANVNVTVPVLTLLGVDDAPADLEGYGPIPADVARRLAAHAPSFTRILTHPETGAVLSVGRTTYAVPADLKKWLRVRDRTCRHPGCTIPASRCELDHTTPWSHGGLTSHDNLAHLCRKHHALKSEGIWRYEQHTAGILTATSPTGRTYDTEADPPPF